MTRPLSQVQLAEDPRLKVYIAPFRIRCSVFLSATPTLPAAAQGAGPTSDLVVPTAWPTPGSPGLSGPRSRPFWG